MKPNNETVRVNKNVIDIMSMPRSARRRIARLNGLKNIPSIINVQVTTVPQEQVGIPKDVEIVETDATAI